MAGVNYMRWCMWQAWTCVDAGSVGFNAQKIDRLNEWKGRPLTHPALRDVTVNTQPQSPEMNAHPEGSWEILLPHGIATYLKRIQTFGKSPRIFKKVSIRTAFRGISSKLSSVSLFSPEGKSPKTANSSVDLSTRAAVLVEEKGVMQTFLIKITDGD